MLYTIRPKNNAWHTRHRLAAERAGFRWEHNCYLLEAERPPRVWGCTVSRYQNPKPRGMWKTAGEILNGKREF